MFARLGVHRWEWLSSDGATACYHQRLKEVANGPTWSPKLARP